MGSSQAPPQPRLFDMLTATDRIVVYNLPPEEQVDLLLDIIRHWQTYIPYFPCSRPASESVENKRPKNKSAKYQPVEYPEGVSERTHLIRLAPISIEQHSEYTYNLYLARDGSLLSWEAHYSINTRHGRFALKSSLIILNRGELAALVVNHDKYVICSAISTIRGCVEEVISRAASKLARVKENNEPFEQAMKRLKLHPHIPL